MYSPDLAIEPVVGSPLKITTPPPSKQSHVPLIAVTLCSLTMVREYYCPIKSKLSLIRENKLRMKGTDEKKNPQTIIMSYVYVCNLYMYLLHL